MAGFDRRSQAGTLSRRRPLAPAIDRLDSLASDTLLDLHHALCRPAIPEWSRTSSLSNTVSHIHPTTAILDNYIYIGGREVDSGGNRAMLLRHPVYGGLVNERSRWRAVQLPQQNDATDCYGAFVYRDQLHIVLLISRRTDQLFSKTTDGVSIWCQRPGEHHQDRARCLSHFPTFRWHFGLTLCGNYLVMVGGWEISHPVAKVSAFNLDLHEWEEWPDLPEPLTGPVALTLRKRLVVVGGFTHHSKPNKRVFVLPLTGTKRWLMDVVPDTALGACGATLFEGRLLVAGGREPGGKIGQTVSVLDEESGSWLKLPNLLKARCTPVIATLDRRVLCIAGRTNTIARTSVEELDLTEWQGW